MDMIPVQRIKSIPTETKGYRDQNAALARDLAPIAQITGQAVAPKTLKGDFLGLEIDRTNLVAVCRFLRDQLGFDRAEEHVVFREETGERRNAGEREQQQRQEKCQRRIAAG